MEKYTLSREYMVMSLMLKITVGVFIEKGLIKSDDVARAYTDAYDSIAKDYGDQYPMILDQFRRAAEYYGGRPSGPKGKKAPPNWLKEIIEGGKDDA